MRKGIVGRLALSCEFSKRRALLVTLVLTSTVVGLSGSQAGHAADWDGGPPPPAIAKARPSASVPADLPGSRVDTCRLLGSVQVYRPVGRGTYVGVVPTDVFGSSSGCSGGAPPVASPLPALAPDGGALPFDDD